MSLVFLYIDTNVKTDYTVFINNDEFVAQYVYDAWGNHIVQTYKENPEDESASVIGYINRIRYRGYYFDCETGLYYLQTRYYDPETGRFISADSLEYLDPETLGGLNLYAYCGNNPVMAIDPMGTSAWSDFWTGVRNTFIKVGNWINNNIIQPTVNFVKDNLDIIIATFCVVAIVALTIVSLGTFSAAAVLTGMVIGAAIGAFDAYTSGGNVVQGAIIGGIVGIFGAINPLAGGFAAAGLTLIQNRVNGNKADKDTYKEAFSKFVTASICSALGSVGVNAIVGTETATVVVYTVNIAMGALFFVANWVADLYISAWRKNRK